MGLGALAQYLLSHFLLVDKVSNTRLVSFSFVFFTLICLLLFLLPHINYRAAQSHDCRLFLLVFIHVCGDLLWFLLRPFLPESPAQILDIATPFCTRLPQYTFQFVSKRVWRGQRRLSVSEIAASLGYEKPASEEVYESEVYFWWVLITFCGASYRPYDALLPLNVSNVI